MSITRFDTAETMFLCNMCLGILGVQVVREIIPDMLRETVAEMDAEATPAPAPKSRKGRKSTVPTAEDDAGIDLVTGAPDDTADTAPEVASAS